MKEIIECIERNKKELEKFSSKYNRTFAYFEDLFYYNTSELIKVFNDIERNNIETFNKNYEQDIKIFDMGLCLIFDLSLLFNLQYINETKQKKEKPPLCFIKPNIISNKLIFSISCFLTTLSNTLLAIRKMAYCGFTNQMRVMSRYFIETSELIIALLYDPKLYSIYMSDEDDDYNKWKKYFTPNKIRQILSNFENESTNFELNLDNFRKDNYSFLSKTAHNDFLFFHLGSYGHSLNEEGMLHYTGGGAITKEIEELLNIVINSTYIFLTYFTTILCESYKVRFLYYNDDEDCPYLVGLKIYRNLHSEYYLTHGK